MSKILVISEYFAPQNKIAAVRLTKLVKYLNKDNEHEFLVISNENDEEIIDPLLQNDVKNKANVIRIQKSSLTRSIKKKLLSRKRNTADVLNNKIVNRNIPKKPNRITRIKEIIFYSLDYLESMIFKSRAISLLKHIDLSDYTHVISTYGPVSCHIIAKSVKDKYNKIFWIADFRDSIVNDYTPFFFKKYLDGYVRKTCENTDVITAVSQGCMESLCIDDWTNKYVVTNGYDESDLDEIVESSPNKKMTFVYTGVLYNGKRDLSSIFKAIRDLVDEGLINNEKIEIIYAGNSRKDFTSQVNKYNLLGETIIYEQIARDRSLKLQKNADILLLASWNNDGNEGILTGKFFEYLMMSKPILATITGDLPGSELRKIINENYLGFCYEEANSVKDFVALKEYIYLKYVEFTENNKLEYNPNEGFINKYSYNNIASEFKKLIKL